MTVRVQRFRARLRRDDRGGGAVQLPIMAGTYVLFIMLLVFVGRVNAGYSAAETAARSAARTLSIARDPSTAITTAQRDAATIVDVGSSRCRSMELTHTFDDKEATVTVTCVVDLGEVSIISVPGDWRASATASEPIDQHREGESP